MKLKVKFGSVKKKVECFSYQSVMSRPFLFASLHSSLPNKQKVLAKCIVHNIIFLPITSA